MRDTINAIINVIKKYQIRVILIVAAVSSILISVLGIETDIVNLFVLAALFVLVGIIVVVALCQIFKPSEQDRTKECVLNELVKILGQFDTTSITTENFYKNEKNNFSSRSYEHFRLSYNILAFVQKQKTGHLEYVIKHKRTSGDVAEQNLKSLIGLATAMGSIFSLMNLSIEGDFQKFIGVLCVLGVSFAWALFINVTQYDGSDEKFYRDIIDDILSEDGDVKTINVPARN